MIQEKVRKKPGRPKKHILDCKQKRKKKALILKKVWKIIEKENESTDWIEETWDYLFGNQSNQLPQDVLASLEKLIQNFTNQNSPVRREII